MDVKTKIAALLFLSLFGLSSSNRQHIIVKDKMNWTDARQYCKKNYGDLSTITKEDIRTLSQNADIADDYFYIGLQRDVPNSGWMWSDGSPSSLNEWDSNQGGRVGENCGAVKISNLKMHDFLCSISLAFYCMVDMDMVVESRTWEEALNYCTQRNTGLVSTNSSKMMDLAVNMATNAQTVNVWIGLRFLAGHWLWVNGGDFAYKAWSEEGELLCPAMNQRCGALDKETRVWRPIDCQERLNFFCFRKPRY